VKTVAFYISGHGFGHASRTIEVINAMLAQQRDVRIVIRTSAARWLFERTLSVGPGHTLQFHELETDTGIAQIDSLHLDEHETLRRVRVFMDTFDARVEREVAFLIKQEVALVVADIPPLGIAAGHRAGIPAVGLGNFTWDWIYSGYDGARDVADRLGQIYATARSALRLPMHGGFETFPTVIDLPFVARRSSREPSATRQALKLPESERLALVSFGGYGLNGLNLEALARLEGHVALLSAQSPMGEPPAALRSGRRGSWLLFDERAMYAAGFRYEDLVHAVDVVITKPGYGIISECIANDTALLYTSRGHFVEYDVLVSEMPRFLRARYISHDDLFAGEWGHHLDALLAQAQPPEIPSVNGAAIAAKQLLAFLE
jgi:UDP:flavonoid glycosyltransferase YjiC (YdhE family)